MVVNTQATPGDGRWWSGRKSDQGLAGCVSGPVHNQDHTMKHLAQLPAHQVRCASTGAFDHGIIGQIGGTSPALLCGFIAALLLICVFQDCYLAAEGIRVP